MRLKKLLASIIVLTSLASTNLMAEEIVIEERDNIKDGIEIVKLLEWDSIDRVDISLGGIIGYKMGADGVEREVKVVIKDNEIKIGKDEFKSLDGMWCKCNEVIDGASITIYHNKTDVEPLMKLELDKKCVESNISAVWDYIEKTLKSVCVGRDDNKLEKVKDSLLEVRKEVGSGKTTSRVESIDKYKIAFIGRLDGGITISVYS